MVRDKRSRAISKLSVALIAVIVIAVVAGAFTYSMFSAPKPQQAQQGRIFPDKITIGLTVGLSGGYAFASYQGLLGIQAAVKWINDVYGGIRLGDKRVKIELKYYNDESNKDRAIGFYERLITVDKVDLLLAPYGSPLVFAVAPIAEKYHKLLVNWMGASDTIHQQGYKYVVQVLTPASRQWIPLISLLKKIDPNATVAVIFKDDEYNRIVGGSFLGEAAKSGVKIVYFKTFPPDIKDFTPIFTDLNTYKPSVIAIAGHEVDGVLAAQQLAQLGINAKLMVMTFVPGLASFKNTLGNLVEGWVGTTVWTPGASWTPEIANKSGYEWFGPTEDEFLKLYYQFAKPEDFPSEHAGAGAAAILVLVKAIEKAQSLDQDAIRKTFNDLRVATFFGPFRIDPDTGLQIAKSQLLAQWQKGKYVPIWPEDVALSKPVYPIPTWDEKRAGKQAVPSP